jgi:GT2 family glycosyltransferase
MTDHLGRGQARKDWESKEAAYCDAVTFAAALIKRDTWDFLGGLDEAYRYGWEDTDFCMRVLEAGGAIKCARDAVALHDECGTRPRGGQNDSTNYQLFTSRWEAKIPALLTAYHQRMA